MIRNVCIHIANEQPLLADLYAVPTAADAGLLCTNVRMMDGKRPVFIDAIGATFFFPYHVVRFIEIPIGALDAGDAPAAPASATNRSDAASRSNGHAPVDDRPELRLPVPVGPPPGINGADGPELDLEIDEDFLRRVRDI